MNEKFKSQKYVKTNCDFEIAHIWIEPICLNVYKSHISKKSDNRQSYLLIQREIKDINNEMIKINSVDENFIIKNIINCRFSSSFFFFAVVPTFPFLVTATAVCVNVCAHFWPYAEE